MPCLFLQPKMLTQSGLQTVWLIAVIAAINVGCAPHGSRAAAGEPRVGGSVFFGEFGALQQDSADSTQPHSSLSDRQQRQLQIFRVTLLSPAADIDAETRRSAAQELLAMQVPEAVAAIEQALRSGQTPIILAAVSAMQSTPEPVAELLQPALDVLPGSPPQAVDALAWALTRYGERALETVTALAADQNASVELRLAPVQALSAFDSKNAAAAIMDLINDPSEPQEIINAARESLQRLTGLAYGNDLAQWQTWWAEAQQLPADEWSAFITRSLSKRASQLQIELQKQQDAHDRLARELVATYRDLYPLLPTDDQLRRLPGLLQNQLAPVREFALSRTSLLLRDSVQIPPEVQQLVADRLGDESLALRMQAARLLDELNYSQAGPAIAAKIGAESSPQALELYLDLLLKHPCVEAVDAAHRLLGNQTHAARAASVIWQSLTSGSGAHDQQRLKEAIRQTWNRWREPAAARLLALVGDDRDVASLSVDLDADDAALRSAIAEGFCQRGLKQPLIDRASDPAVFPFAVRSLADGAADLAAFRQLADLPVSDATYRTWSEGMVKLIGRLPAASLVPADDVLSAATHIDSITRLRLLNRAASLGREEITAEQRQQIIDRYLALVIDQGQASRAVTLLEPAHYGIADLRPICFAVTVLTGHYDRAADLQPVCGAWVSLLKRVAAQDLSAAEPLHAEIQRRFQSQLTADDQTALQQVADALRDARSVSVYSSDPQVMPQ